MKSARHSTLQSLPFHYSSILVITFPLLLETCHYASVLYLTLPFLHGTVPHSSIAIRYFIPLHASFALHGRSVHHSAFPSLHYGNSLPHSAILLLHLTAHNFTWPSLDLNSPFFCIIMLNINLEC